MNLSEKEIIDLFEKMMVSFVFLLQNVICCIKQQFYYNR